MTAVYNSDIYKTKCTAAQILSKKEETWSDHCFNQVDRILTSETEN